MRRDGDLSAGWLLRPGFLDAAAATTQGPRGSGRPLPPDASASGRSRCPARQASRQDRGDAAPRQSGCLLPGPAEDAHGGRGSGHSWLSSVLTVAGGGSPWGACRLRGRWAGTYLNALCGAGPLPAWSRPGMGRWCPGTRSSVHLGGAGDWARPGSSQDQSGRKRSRPRPSTELRPLVLATTQPTLPSLSWGRQRLASLPQAPSAVALSPPRAALRGLLCGPRPRPRPCWPARQPQPGSSHWTATHRRQEATAGCWEGRGHRDRAAGHQLARTWPRRAAEPSPTVPGYGSQSPAVPS